MSKSAFQVLAVLPVLAFLIPIYFAVFIWEDKP